MDYEKDFGLRLSRIRSDKDVSARNMSFSLGMSPGYISSIENGRSFPRMGTFFNICESLDVTPVEFFDYNLQHPAEMARLSQYMLMMNERQREYVIALAKDVAASGQGQGRRK